MTDKPPQAAEETSPRLMVEENPGHEESGAATPAPPRAAQHMLGRLSPQMLLGTAHRIVEAVDQGQVELVWEKSSRVLKELWPREDFCREMTRIRAGREAGHRSWELLNVVENSQDEPVMQHVPAGNYANCVFILRFAESPSCRETVTFRLDEDKTWRLVGYAMQ